MATTHVQISEKGGRVLVLPANEVRLVRSANGACYVERNGPRPDIEITPEEFDRVSALLCGTQEHRDPVSFATLAASTGYPVDSIQGALRAEPCFAQLVHEAWTMLPGELAALWTRACAELPERATAAEVVRTMRCGCGRADAKRY